MYIKQYLLDVLSSIKEQNKVWVIYGPRRVGKTMLVNKFLEHKRNYLLVSGDDIDVHYYLASQSLERLKAFVGDRNWLVIDEAQRIPNIGLNLKLLVDNMPNLQVIATGSSAFDLAQQVGEPLTGRKLTFKMFPLSQIELANIESVAQTRANLELRLIYGAYPEIVLSDSYERRQQYLRELVSSYLYKDILEMDGIRKAKKITNLLQLLAFQIGKEVSLNELGQQLGLSKGTVERYLDLLEQAFVLIRLTAFSRNLRKEVSKKSRYYFYDNGVRNAIINHFNPIALRDDIGMLWENYIAVERLKNQSYHNIQSNNYFWRTYSQQEIDWVEERDGKLHGYEIKWNPSAKVKTPADWANTSVMAIHRDNYLNFIMES